MRQNDDGKTVSAMDMLVPRVCPPWLCYSDLGNFGALSLPCLAPFVLKEKRFSISGKMNKSSLRHIFFGVFPSWNKKFGTSQGYHLEKNYKFISNSKEAKDDFNSLDELFLLKNA